MIIFYRIIFDNFGGDLFWTANDFILHMILAAILFALGGIFMWKDALFHFIKDGELNVFLIRPLNRSYMFYTTHLASPAIVFLLIDFIVLIGFLIYSKIQLTNLFLGTVVALLIFLFFITVYSFMYSIDLIFLGVSESVGSVLFKMQSLFEMYPAPFFLKLSVKYLFMVFPIFFTGTLLIPVIRGYEVWNIGLQFSILIGLIIFFFLGTIINWHYGLKKYEAFG
jgi:ABC-type uncharacterized transport system permease subunit